MRRKERQSHNSLGLAILLSSISNIYIENKSICETFSSISPLLPRTFCISNGDSWFHLHFCVRVTLTHGDSHCKSTLILQASFLFFSLLLNMILKPNLVYRGIMLQTLSNITCSRSHPCFSVLFGTFHLTSPTLHLYFCFPSDHSSLASSDLVTNLPAIMINL